MAFDLGKLYALHELQTQLNPPLSKVAYSAGPWLADMLAKGLPSYGPAALGAYMAGPGYRLEGAGAGFLAGHLGKGLGRQHGIQSNPELAKLRQKATEEQILSGLRSRSKQYAHLKPDTLEGLDRSELVGGLVGGAGGGYAAGRMLGVQNPYGLQPVFGGLGKENPTGMRDPGSSLLAGL